MTSPRQRRKRERAQYEEGGIRDFWHSYVIAASIFPQHMSSSRSGRELGPHTARLWTV